MARARKNLDWKTQFELAIDPEKARRLRAESGVDEEHGACTMCGSLCAYKVMNERHEKKSGNS
jgi:phosphomethylpyrimidine synthase